MTHVHAEADVSISSAAVEINLLNKLHIFQ